MSHLRKLRNWSHLCFYLAHLSLLLQPTSRRCAHSRGVFTRFRNADISTQRRQCSGSVRSTESASADLESKALRGSAAASGRCPISQRPDKRGSTALLGVERRGNSASPNFAVGSVARWFVPMDAGRDGAKRDCRWLQSLVVSSSTIANSAWDKCSKS